MHIRWLGIAAAAAVAIPMWPQAAAAAARDEFCDHLKVFEKSAFIEGSDHKPIRSFVEFQWSGAWLVGGTWGCRHTADSAAKSFCSYLIGHTNQEFTAALPMGVLTCHGYVFPGHWTDWEGWTADIRLPTPDDDRSIDMDVYLISGSVDAAVRISAVPNNTSSEDKEPPPLKNTAPLVFKGS